MSLTTRSLRLHLLSVLNAPLAGAKVTLQLSAYQADGPDIVPLVWVLPEDGTVPGDYVGPIWPNNRGSGGTHYDMLVQANGQALLRQAITVVEGVGAARIAATVGSPPYPAVYAAELAVAASNVFADAAGESASRAAAALQNVEDIAAPFDNLSSALAVIESSKTAAVNAANVAVPAATTAVSAAGTAGGLINLRASVAVALADGTLANNSFFSTQSPVVGELAIIYQKKDGVAIEQPKRPPSTELVARFLPPESGYTWDLYDTSTGRSPVRLSIDGTFEVDALSLSQPAIDGLAKAFAQVGLMPVLLPPESGYVAAFGDAATGRYPLRLSVDGVLECDALNATLADGSVARSKLESSLQALLPTNLPPESGYSAGFGDPVTGRFPVRITIDGVLEADASASAPGSITPVALADSTKRQVLPQARDVVPVRPDVWRQRNGEISVETALGDGSAWTRLPTRLLRLLRGSNSATANLDVRKSAGLLILGSTYGGAFDPGAYPSTTYKGYVLGPTVTAPTGSFAVGDYYLYANGSGTSGTFGGAAIHPGDALVYGSDSAWHVQGSPGRGSGVSRVHKTWWQVSAAGWFDGVQYAVGDHILYISRQTKGGGEQFDRWYKGDLTKGDLFYRGEFSPASGHPAAPVNCELYQASAAGTADGVIYAAGDYAIYEDGAWGRIPNSAPTTYAPGAYMALPCMSDASEWEVRRTDKSSGSARLPVRFKTQVQMSRRRASDNVYLLSDSMLGNGNAGQQILNALVGRTGVVQAFGGSQSRQVQGMMEYAITQGDLRAGDLLVTLHGQNNQPYEAGDGWLNFAQIKQASLEMAGLAGARDIRLLFLSVLGQRNHAWNGTRITATQHESQVQGAGGLWLLRQWYESTFPGQFVHPHAALLASAKDVADPTFPGMTERQVAAKYGICPWSAFAYPLVNGAASYTPGELVFQGYWSAAGLPSGGSAKQYYIRIGNGTVGTLLINFEGVWTENAIDITHLSESGGAALALGGSGSNLGAGYSAVPAHPGVAGLINSSLI